MLPYTVRGTVWVILYLFFILAPLFALLMRRRWVWISGSWRWR